MARPRAKMMHLERESTLTDWRIKRGITESALATACKISQQIVSGASFGKNPPIYITGPRRGKAKTWAPLMAEVLNVPLTILFPRYFCSLDSTEADAHPEDVTDATISQMTRCNSHRWGGKRHDHIKLKDNIRLAFSSLLSIKHQRVMVLRHFEDYTLEQIGERLGMTRERIRQIEQEAFKRIRNSKSAVTDTLRQIHSEI